MRYGTPSAQLALRGSVQAEWGADLFYDNQRMLADLPITDVRFDEDTSSSIQVSGSCTIVWNDTFGQSVSPVVIGDLFSPFGSELHLYVVVSAGKFSERIQMGVMRISAVPSADDETMGYRGKIITTSSVIELELKDRTYKTSLERFSLATGPSQTLSVWREVARLTGFPLTKNVADTTITGTLVYEDDRLDSLYDLFDLFQGSPHMLSDGTLSCRLDAWPAASDQLKMATHTVKVGQSMVTDRTYNKVVVRSPDSSSSVVLATAEITYGPLRTRNPDGSPSPYGVVPYFVSIPTVTTFAQAQSYANAELPKVSTLQAVQVPVTEFFNPLRERGDVITIERPTRTLTGRVVSISRQSGSATQDLVVEVQGG